MSGRRLPIKRRIEQILNHDISELVLLVLIVLSVVTTVLEVVSVQLGPFVQPWGDALTFLFAVELSLRFWVAKKKSRFFNSYWVDIISVLPLSRYLRVIRVVRLMRAGNIFNRRLAAMGWHQQGIGELLAVGLGMVVLTLLSALVVFLAEGGVGNPELDQFPEVLWFSAYSLVGAEPIGGTPISEVGRWATLALMIGGMGLFGVFVGTISAGMVNRLSERLSIHTLDLDELTDHVVVCGWNASGPTVLCELFVSKAKRPVVLVTEQPLTEEEIPKGIPRNLLYQHVGDYTRATVLEAVSTAEAETVIFLADQSVPRSNQDGDARTVLAALTVERTCPGIYTVAELHSRENEELLRLAGVEEIVVGDIYAGMILGTVQRNPGLSRVLDEIFTQSHGSSFQTVSVPDRWAGLAVREIAAKLIEQRAMLVSVEQDGLALVNPKPGLIVYAGAKLVVIRTMANSDFS